MTTGDEAGRTFWGPHGIMTKSLACMRAAVVELRALVARQAAASLRLLNYIANPGGDVALNELRRALFVCHSHLARAASGLCDEREQQDTSTAQYAARC